MSIISQINDEIKQYQEGVKIVQGLEFKPASLIEDIYRLYNSKFKTGEFDDEGFKKYFLNITHSVCDVYTKLIDFDLKDILFIPEPNQDEFKVWLLERKFHYWAKKNNFGRTLNRIFKELPIFGTVILKKINKRWEFVDLRNIFVDPSAESLDKATFIIERHIYTPTEFIQVGEKLGWENISEVVEANEKPLIEVYERYGYVWDEEKNNWSYHRTIVYPTQERDELTGEEIREGYILEDTEVEKHPYFDFHINKINGRFLGIGIVELLFDPQRRINEIINLKVKASYWSSLQIFQTQDDSFTRNLLTQVKNGEVLRTRTGITPINNIERNLSSLFEEEKLWMNNRNEITSVYDLLMGRNLPSGVPLGVAQITATMGTSYFELLRENIALRLKDWLYGYILPDFQEEIKGDELILLTGKDYEQVRDKLKKVKEWEKIQNFIRRNHTLPTEIQLEAIRDALNIEFQQMKSITLSIPKGYFDNIQYSLEIVITGESIDTRAKMISYQTILQMINNNPQAFANPTTRKIIYRMMALAGISPEEIDIPDTENQQSLSQGGSIAKPVIPSNLVMLPQEKTL